MVLHSCYKKEWTIVTNATISDINIRVLLFLIWLPKPCLTLQQNVEFPKLGTFAI